MYENPVPTPQITEVVSIIKTNWLVLYKEVVAWCCEDRMEHPTALCGIVQSFLISPHLVRIVTIELQMVNFFPTAKHVLRVSQ